MCISCDRQAPRIRETSGSVRIFPRISTGAEFLISSTVTARSRSKRPTRAAQFFQMRAAAERLADVMRVSADIKALAAEHGEIDLRRRDPIDPVTIDVHEARLALDHLALARQLVERHAALFDRRNHRRHLVEIAAEFFKGRPHLFLGQLRHRSFFEHLPARSWVSVVAPSDKRADVFLVLAHEQILDLRPAAEGENEQTGGDRVERAAMADLFDLELAPNERDDIVRGHAGGFVDQQDAVRSVVRALK